jgi:hypothetical protein
LPLNGAAPAGRKAEPLKTAWESMVPDKERAKELEAMTSAQRYDHQLKTITAAQKATRGKTFAVRLKCIGVIEPPEKDKLMLVQGQYADPEYQSLFGKDATIGIWTPDYKTALQLKVGEEFELQGKVICEMHHAENDVARVPSQWQQKAITVSVVLLRHDLTKWVRESRIYMVNPTIVKLPVDPAGQQ